MEDNKLICEMIQLEVDLNELKRILNTLCMENILKDEEQLHLRRLRSDRKCSSLICSPYGEENKTKNSSYFLIKPGHEQRLTITAGGITHVPTNQSVMAKFRIKQFVTERKRRVVKMAKITKVLPTMIVKSFFLNFGVYSNIFVCAVVFLAASQSTYLIAFSIGITQLAN
uniref:Uncharacterized protein n=1 Tax=Glossina brevipalpis TaxID=37001 RepID=A0A1A9WBV0_9MUSC